MIVNRERIAQLLQEHVGVDRAGFDRNCATGVVLWDLLRTIADREDTIRRHGATIAADLSKVLDGGEALALAACSSSRSYDAAIAQLQVLRHLLPDLVDAYRHRDGRDQVIAELVEQAESLELQAATAVNGEGLRVAAEQLRRRAHQLVSSDEATGPGAGGVS